MKITSNIQDMTISDFESIKNRIQTKMFRSSLSLFILQVESTSFDQLLIIRVRPNGKDFELLAEVTQSGVSEPWKYANMMEESIN